MKKVGFVPMDGSDQWIVAGERIDGDGSIGDRLCADGSVNEGKGSHHVEHEWMPKGLKKVPATCRWKRSERGFIPLTERRSIDGIVRTNKHKKKGP